MCRASQRPVFHPILTLPSIQYYESYRAALRESRQNHVSTYQFLDAASDSLFNYYVNMRTSENLPDGYVNATYLWLVEAEIFVGEVSIRHRLTDALRTFGGHIGYAVRPSKWNQGYGTAMLSMALDYAHQSLDLHRVLVTCNDDNLASARIIEKNGGVLQDKIINVIEGEKRLTRRYWIDISDR